MFYTASRFKAGIKKALSDDVLTHNLRTFFKNYRVSFAKAYENLDFETLRKQVGAIRDLSLSERMELFSLFKSNVEKSGGIVYQAKDADEACKYITDICKQKRITTVVKSKSMTAEEIGLNAYLEKEGITPIETDLGEWIIQLAGEKPSHMIMPAIHKNRHQVAELFRKHTGEDVDENDIEKMVKIARRVLRRHYFQAQAGISGANIAVAESGAIGIVTNEGNGRLVTTIPPVHFVILGYEKLVRSFDEALKVLRLLPKNATGQIISVYVSWIKGALDSIKNETGTKEIHYVFLDNGRLALFDNPLIREAYRCIRCGSCANVCPVYGSVGGHVFGHIYTGPIGVVLTAMYHGAEKSRNLLELCTGCRACSSICPANIDIQHLIMALNAASKEKFGISPLKKMVYSQILSKPTSMKTITKLAGGIIKPVSEKGYIKPALFGSHSFRNLPTPKQVSFSDMFKEIQPLNTTARKRVFFYPGCAIEYIYPQVGVALVKLLRKARIDVDIPARSVCCGLPAMHDGDRQSAKKTMINNLKYLGNPERYDAYVMLCPTCASTYIHLMEKLLFDEPDEIKKLKAILPKIVMLSEYLQHEKVHYTGPGDVKFTYHAPCHQSRGLNLNIEPFLKELLGENFVELPEADHCCGFGGSFSFDYPEISSAILERKIENIKSTGANVVLTECPGCVMQIDGGLKKKALNVNVMHLAEFFEEYVSI